MNAEPIEPTSLKVGQVIQVTRRTPMMPTPEPKVGFNQILNLAAQAKQMTPGEAFEIAEVRDVAGRRWYRAETEEGEPDRWVNAAALMGQQLKVIG